MSNKKHHAEWLSLLEISGPFVSLPVLEKVFPQGLDAHDADHARRMRLAYDEWETNQSGYKPSRAIHRAWIEFVLKETLTLPDEVLATGQSVPQTLKATHSEAGETIRPDYLVRNPKGIPDAGKPRLLIQVYPAEQHLEKHVHGLRWKASPADRMAELLKQTKCQLGLVTNGEHWILTNKTEELPTGFASFYSGLWLEEPITLRAFRNLLEARRFFGALPGQTLEGMLVESATHQQEVTDQLGLQVRRAVEVLIQSLDRADQDHGRKLLGDPLYDQHYAVSTLVAQLQETADNHGEEILERRLDAWSRLLSTFRAVFGGVQHERMKLPAYAGNLFDPDRFPFLEGRQKKTSWTDTPANPLPVNNRTVLHLLRSLQFLQTHGEAQRISFRALGIEQIGHVYEGLLDHTAKRAIEPVLGLSGTKGKEPEVALSALEEAGRGWSVEGGETPPKKLVEFLKKETGRSASALKNALLKTHSTLHDSSSTLIAACGNNKGLYERVAPFARLIRNDSFDRPVVVRKGSVFVTAGTDRRTTGTHYTPTSLTEPIVKHTLDPLCYIGPAEGKPEDQWQLRPAKALLDLKVCDMACGSGAFLVQACRYLSEKLVEAWETVEQGARGEGLGTSNEWSDHDHQALPGTRGVAEGDGISKAVLPSDQAIPERGNVRNDEPDSPGGSLDSGQHSRGSRQGAHEGVSESPEHRTGVTGGSRDALDPQPGREPTQRRESPNMPGALQRDQPNALRPAQVSGTSNLTLTPHPSSLAPRITPYGDPATGAPSEQLIPVDTEERLVYARRLVAQRCLYGVDKNPLAVEMAKLSLWLLTLAKDKPFTFLDHSIRCGDSLVGISSIDQLLRFSLDERVKTGPLLEQQRKQIERRLDAVKLLRRQIEERPSNTAEDIERKAAMLKNTEEQTRRLTYAADMLLAVSWQPMSASERESALNDALVQVEYKFKDLPVEQLDREAEEAWRVATGEKPSSPEPRTPHPGTRRFHWPLEFPEVFDRGGFDAFVCNPPFMGGQKITGNLGTDYRNHLVEHLAAGQRGSAGLCAYFLLRAASLLKPSGQLGFLATNTIAQGDTREVGLDQLTAGGCTIPRAVPSRPWPGTASLEVAHLWLRRGDWQGAYLLDDKPVEGITSFLTVPGTVTGKPYRLKANEGKSFQGSIVLGMGFVLGPDEAQALIDKDPRNKDVLFPYLNGQDLNSRPDQSPSRWVINFFDWPLRREAGGEGRGVRASWEGASEKQRREWLRSGIVPDDYPDPVTADYPDCLRIVEEKVKPERMRNNRKVYREKWWQYAEKRPDLYRTIAGLDRVLAFAQTSKTKYPVFFAGDIVFDQKVVVIASSGSTLFTVLCSTIHYWWVLLHGSSLRTDAVYTPSDCFETFPFPNSPLAPHPSPLESIGETYHEHRRRIMLARGEGLTKTYNRFHDAEVGGGEWRVESEEFAGDFASDEAIVFLRHLHVEMDRAVALAYGWPILVDGQVVEPDAQISSLVPRPSPLDLAHGFHKTKQGVRFTISEPARREVLQRLLKLNHERYEEEVKQGLHDKKKGRGTRGKGRGRKKTAKKQRETLFDTEGKG